MRILVFGAGAMGSFLGALLSARHEVTLVGRANHVAAIRRNGLRVTGQTSRIAKLRAVTRVPQGARPDLVVVSTKAYDTRSAMRRLAPFRATALFLSLQNGLGNGKAIAQVARRVVVGTTAHGVTLVGPGTIRHAGVGETVIGAWSNVDEDDLAHVREAFDEAGLTTRITSDIHTELWAKVVVNAAINPIAALAGVPNGRLVTEHVLARALEAVAREAAGIAKADGASIDPSEAARRAALVARRTATNRCSMLQDLERGRRTEIDAITGAVVRAARHHRLSAPLNELLYGLVRAREPSRFRDA